MCDRTPNLEIPGDLELRHDLASEEDLEIRQKRTINKSAQSTCSRRSAHEAVKFNVYDHRIVPSDVEFKFGPEHTFGASSWYAPGFQTLLIDQTQPTTRMLSRDHHEESELWQADT